MRALALAIVWVAAVVAVIKFCVAPARCNAETLAVENTTKELVHYEETMRAASIARDNLARLHDCIDGWPTVRALMTAATNARILGRNEEAISLYKRAMEYDRRPELYLGLGTVELAAGRPEGIDHLFVACVNNPWIVDDLELGHDIVKQRIEAYKASMSARALSR